MTVRPLLRLFLDSNILVRAMVSRWGLDKAVISLCAARVCTLVLSEAVKEEVEENILIHADRLDRAEAGRVLNEYSKLIDLTRPESVPYPDQSDIAAGRQLIRHRADVPVLLSAMTSKPDWLLTHNTEQLFYSSIPEDRIANCNAERLLCGAHTKNC